MDRNGQKLFGNLKRRSSLAFVISTGRDVQISPSCSYAQKFTQWRICKKSHKRIFVKFAILAIIVKITTLDGAPLPHHLTCSYHYGEFRHFHSFRQICHFRQNRQYHRAPLIIFTFTCFKGFGEFSRY